ncbi:AAA family ATPase [Marseilla massiliensis]|uniref:AAA family ATPase n=1 Tax=Marseilla massiliensis TaxID=1841864 RepID=UPI0030C87DB5
MPQHPYTHGPFSLVALRILPTCDDRLKKVLSQEWHFFNNWYDLTDGNTLKKKESAKFVRTMFGKNISVQAIVGKNGSGKSSVMELIYRMINNLSHCITENLDFPAADTLWFVRGIHAELYFESEDRLGSLKCVDLRMRFEWGDVSIILNAHSPNRVYHRTGNEHLAYITRKFCYCLVSNYALLSLDPHDYDSEPLYGTERKSGNWLNSIYNKNDGYTAAIGIEPYRAKGIVDLHRQKELCTARLYGILIETNNKETDFFDGYSYDSISLEYNPNYLSQKFGAKDEWLHYSRHPNREFPNLYRKGEILAAHIFRCFNLIYLNLKDYYVCMAASYIVVKSLQIAKIYPKYDKYKVFGDIGLYAKPWDKFLEENESVNAQHPLDKLLDDFVADLLKDQSHITLKLRQALNFLRAVEKKYESEGKKWQCPEFKTYDEYVVCLFPKEQQKAFEASLDGIMDYFPPPFFRPRIFLKKNNERNIPFERLSTGERQLIQTSVSILYHIHNIDSIPDIDGMAKYNNVTLFMDEIETCFHPEYQKRFLSLLLNLIKSQGLNNKLGINIIVATHSPFILSDIPQSNILFLETGKVVDTKYLKNPFCGNVNDILHQSFFLHDGFMGDFAKNLINGLIAYLSPQLNTPKYLDFDFDEESAKALIDMVGEPILRKTLLQLYYKRFQPDKDALIKWHEDEIRKLRGEN